MIALIMGVLVLVLEPIGVSPKVMLLLFSNELGILATGSNDMKVRLWNPVVTARPVKKTI